MYTHSISVTEAARNFSDCVNRARYQGVTFILHRNGVPVARIVPEAQRKQTAIREVETPAAEQVIQIASAITPARSLW